MWEEPLLGSSVPCQAAPSLAVEPTCCLLLCTLSPATGQCEVFVRGGRAFKLSAYCGPFAGSVPLLIPADWSLCLFFFPLMWKSKLGPLVFPPCLPHPWVHSPGLAAWWILWRAVGWERWAFFFFCKQVAFYEGCWAVCQHSISCCQRNNMYNCPSDSLAYIPPVCAQHVDFQKSGHCGHICSS